MSTTTTAGIRVREQVNFRLAPGQLARVERFRKHLIVQRRGMPVTQAEAVRVLLQLALPLAEEEMAEAAEVPIADAA